MTSEIADGRPRARPGRPVDPGIEPRVLEIALDIYAETGWAGFTIDAVARRSRVGKAAIYRRWATKEDLIAAAMASLRSRQAKPAGGSFRDDLLHIAEMYSHRYLGRHGLAYLRAQVEAKVYPEVLGQALEAMRRSTVAKGRRIVAAAVERGELPEGASPALILDALAGAIVHHILLMPVDRMADLAADPSKLCEQVVDFVLNGAEWRPPAR